MLGFSSGLERYRQSLRGPVRGNESPKSTRRRTLPSVIMEELPFLYQTAGTTITPVIDRFIDLVDTRL